MFGNPDGFKLVIEYGPAQDASPAASSMVRLPKALATLEIAWTSDESEAAVVERLAQRKSSLVLDRMEERVVLDLQVHAGSSSSSDTSALAQGRLVSCQLKVAPCAPVLRSIHALRTTATSGNVSYPLLTALLKHCELRGVWHVKGAEGFGNWWASCVEVSQWESMRNLNLSSSNLTSLPSTVGELQSLRILRLSHNRLTSLPADLGRLQQLEVLAADHNLLTTVPGICFRQCMVW
jgi:Leucine-rich repeat (LRR) protein